MLWNLAAGGTTTVGTLAAAWQMPWPSVVAVLVASGLLAATLTLSADTVVSDRVDLGRAGRAGLVTGLLVVAATGLAGWFGFAGVALLALVLVCRPGLRSSVREAAARRRERLPAQDQEPERQRHRGDPAAWLEEPVAEERDDAWERTLPGSLATEPQPNGARADTDVPLDTAPDWSPTLTVPTHLSDQDLCLAWESSSRALGRCTSTGARLEVVRVRQACLDELERRHPEGVRAWVLAGADPASSPARYLAG